MLLWKFSVCNSKKSKFLKEQEAWGLLSSFQWNSFLRSSFALNLYFKTFLSGDKFVAELHLRPGF